MRIINKYAEHEIDGVNATKSFRLKQMSTQLITENHTICHRNKSILNDGKQYWMQSTRNMAQEARTARNQFGVI